MLLNLTGATELECEKFSEAEAIQCAKQGNAQAFEALYHMHKRRVYALCLRMTANLAGADDLTQEVFLQVFRKIGTFRGEAAFATWLHRTTVNFVLMYFRKKTLATVPHGSAFEGEERAPIRESGEEDARLAGSINRLDLTRAIAGLPRGCRTIFVLHDVEGYEHHEIAAMLGCSLGNSKSQLHKARMRLRNLLIASRTKRQLNRCEVGAV